MGGEVVSGRNGCCVGIRTSAFVEAVRAANLYIDGVLVTAPTLSQRDAADSVRWRSGIGEGLDAWVSDGSGYLRYTERDGYTAIDWVAMGDEGKGTKR